MNALGHGHDAVLLLVVDALHVSQEGIHVEVPLGEVNEVGTVALHAGQSGSGSQPAGVTAHALDDGHHAGVVHMAVTGDFHDGGGNILGSGSEAGAMIGTGQVVVDGLGHAHDPALIADLVHILGNFVAGVHGVVAAVVEEVTDVVLLEDLQDALIIGVVHIGIGDLIAAGAQSGRRGVEHMLQLSGIFLVHDHQLVVQNALDAVERTVHLGNVGIFQSGLNDAVGGAVNDRRGAAGLADDNGTDESFFRHDSDTSKNRILFG